MVASSGLHSIKDRFIIVKCDIPGMRSQAHNSPTSFMVGKHGMCCYCSTQPLPVQNSYKQATFFKARQYTYWWHFSSTLLRKSSSSRQVGSRSGFCTLQHQHKTAAGKIRHTQVRQVQWFLVKYQPNGIGRKGQSTGAASAQHFVTTAALTQPI